MFSKEAVRSRKDIQKGLLRRAFQRGGVEAREQMQLLIEWRLAACRHSNEKALDAFSDNYKLDELGAYASSGSRALDAFNWIATIEGRNDRLADMSAEQAEKRIADMARMHDMVRFFKNSEIVVDREALAKAAMRRNPHAPILVDLPRMQPGQRSEQDPVHAKSFETPAYLKTLAEIDAEFERAYGAKQTHQSGSAEKMRVKLDDGTSISVPLPSNFNIH